MKKLLLLTKTLLAVALLCVGQNAWGAGYTTTLKETYSVTGYVAKAYYDIGASDESGICPVSGDVRFRGYDSGKGGNFGLYNFGSGSRTGNVTLSVKEGDIVVFQESAAGIITGVSSCTKNGTLSTSYAVFDVKSDAASLSVTMNRGTSVLAILVMEPDGEAETADYTINYKDGETTVKTVSGSGVAVGTIVPVLSSFFESDVKYIKNGGEPSSLTVAKGGSVLNVAVSEAPTYSYTVNATDGTNVLRVLASGSTYSGETVNVPFPRYFNVAGTLYEKGAVSSEYRQNVVITSDKQVTNFVYSATGITNVVYYSEGEDISGATSTDAGTNMKTRSSNAHCGYAESDIALTTLPAGKYTAKMVVYSNSSGGATLNFDYDAAYDAVVSGASNWSEKTYEFTLTDSKEVKWLTSGSDKNGLDLIYIQKTGEVATIGTYEYATFSSKYDLDFTTPVAGLTAYKAVSATASTVTLEEVTGKVKAGDGLVIKGAAGTYSIPVTTGASTIYTEKSTINMWGNISNEDETVSKAGSGTNFVLSVQDEKVVFAPINGTSATLNPGQAALWANTTPEARALRISFDDITAVENVEAAAEAKAKEGKFIENGKLVIVKNGVKYNAAGAQVK